MDARLRKSKRKRHWGNINHRRQAPHRTGPMFRVDKDISLSDQHCKPAVVIANILQKVASFFEIRKETVSFITPDLFHLAFISDGVCVLVLSAALLPCLFYHSNGVLSPCRLLRVSTAALSPLQRYILSTSILTWADLTHNQGGWEGSQRKGETALTGIIMLGPWRQKDPH